MCHSAVHESSDSLLSPSSQGILIAAGTFGSCCCQSNFSASLHKWPNRKLLSVGAFVQEEEPGAPAGDPRRGGSGLLCAKPLHRADNMKYEVFLIL